MFKKPTCPYCKAIYTSDEIKKQYNNEKIKCHNCKKIFVVKKNSGLVLIMAILLAILVNIFMMSVIGVRSVIPMFIVTIIIIVIALLMRSFFVKYKKEDYKK